MKNPNVSDIVRSIRKRFRHSEGRKFGTPSRLLEDWRIVLSAFLILSLLIILINVLIFYRVTKGIEISGDAGTATTTISIFNKNELLNAAERASENRRLYLELRSSRPEIVDPSGSSGSSPVPPQGIEP